MHIRKVRNGQSPSGKGGWKPLRHARNAAAAIQQKRSQASNNNDVQTNQVQEEAATTTSHSTSSHSQNIASYSDNFTFAPMPDFVPISSCDNVIEEPDFDQRSDLKISTNFSKMISNAKKVDRVRQAKHVESLPVPNIDTNLTAEDLVKEYEEKVAKQRELLQSKSVDGGESLSEDNTYTTLSIEEAQKNLIKQLKQGLKYLEQENKMLTNQASTFESELIEKRELLILQEKEVEERNLKLAVLEHHFRVINNEGINSGAAIADSKDVEKILGSEESKEAESSTTEENEESKVDESKNTEDSPPSTEETTDENEPKIIPTASSSIIQIDKGYYMDLEASVKNERSKRERVEKVNRDLAMKYAVLERDSEKDQHTLALEMQDLEKVLNETISKQERTIQSLEESLSKSRELLFKKGKKGHKRSHTVSGVPSASTDMLNTSVDEQSIGSSSVPSTANETTVNEEGDILEKEVVKDAIASAVKEALEKQEIEHKSLMDVLSKQLERKDSHISSLENKMFALLKQKNDRGSMVGAQRGISNEYMVRSMQMTNEMLDNSMFKLEKMFKNLKTDDNAVDSEGKKDDTLPVRRVATKIALVEEEMKVSIKLLEQKLQNVSRTIQDETENKKDNENESDNSAQSSGEAAEGEVAAENTNNTEEQIENITKTLKETELSIRDEIQKLNDHLEQIDFDLAAKNDTIEALEIACAEHEERYRSLEKEYEVLDDHAV